MNHYIVIQRPFEYRVEERSSMGPLVAESTGNIQVTLTDEEGTRLLTGVVTVTIHRPDTLEATATDLALAHAGNGVYKAQIPKTALPIPGFNYIAEWSMVVDTDELHPITYFDVYGG